MVASTNWNKLLAAGCVVGLLSGVSVLVEAQTAVVEPQTEDVVPPAEAPVEDSGEAPPPEEDDPAGADGDDDGALDDGQPEGEPEEPEEPEEPDEDEPEYEPEEPEEEEEEEEPEDEAMGPDADEDEPDVDVLPDADPAALMAMGYSVTQNIDYTPGPTKMATVGDISASMVMSAEECAAACDAEPNCNIAAYFTVAPGGQDMNCFLKGISPGCSLPADTDEVENVWLLLSDNKCDVEVTPTSAVAPAAAGAPGVYVQHDGSDYIPFGLPGGPANETLVTIMDIEAGPDAGLLVDDVAGCEAACDTEPACNAASFYKEIVASTGKNCYLKVLGDSCGLPEDALEDTNAILSLKCDTGVAAAPAAVAAAPAAVPAAPGVATAADAPVGDETAGDTTTRDAGTDAVTTTDANAVAPAGSSAAGVCVSVAAIAAAGVVALM